MQCIADERGLGRARVLEVRTFGDRDEIFADWRIGVAYAGWLSPAFAQAVIEALDEWLDEHFSPGLKIDRAIDGYRSRGIRDQHGETWRQAIRLNSPKSARSERELGLTVADRLPDRCLETLFRAIFGLSTDELLYSRDIVGSEPVCDHLDPEEPASFKIGEFIATGLIEARDTRGDAERLAACEDAGQLARRALDAN